MQQRQLNPYAPTTTETALTVPDRDGFPESGIPFAGYLDANEVRKTDRVSLAIGLAIGLTFAGALAVGAVSALTDVQEPGSGYAAAVLMAATIVTLLAVAGFAYTQIEKPIKNFSWMTGPIRGVVYSSRIDMEWDVAEASLAYSSMVSEREFSNQSGRMFEGRGVQCFVPADAVDLRLRTQLRVMDRRHEESAIAPPPPPPADSIVWQGSAEEFVDDLMQHRFVSASPELARPITMLSLISLLSAIMFGGLIHQPKIVLACGMLTVVAGIHWMLQEGTRRNWPFRYSRPLPWFTRPSIPGKAPPFTRWMTSDEVLVGYKDGWIRLPWGAIEKAVISRHAIEVKLTATGIESWFLERAGHDDDQWRTICDLVLSRVAIQEIWGSVRG